MTLFNLRRNLFFKFPPQNFEGSMILEDTNVKEVIPQIMGINKSQLLLL